MVLVALIHSTVEADIKGHGGPNTEHWALAADAPGRLESPPHIRVTLALLLITDN